MLHAVWFSEVPLGRPLHHFPVADISEEPMWCFCKLWTQLTTTDLSSCIKAGKPSSNPVWLVFSVKHPDEQVNISDYTVTACLFKKKCSFCKILFQYRPLRRVNKFYKYLEGNLRETQVVLFLYLRAKMRPGWYSAVQKHEWPCWLSFTGSRWAGRSQVSMRGKNQVLTREKHRVLA